MRISQLSECALCKRVLLESLSFLLQCCSRVKLSDTALARFPDVKENLIYKLGAEIDDHLQHMHGAMYEAIYARNDEANF